MNYLYSLKVYPKGCGRDIYRKIEMSGNSSLDKLCATILRSFDFDDEHLYEFCMDNKMYSRYSYQSDPEYGMPSTRVELDELGLYKKQKFLLHYDFGDDWQFVINVENITPSDKPVIDRITMFKGEIHQYPNIDDWDENE